MKIIIIGATGTIGGAVAAALEQRHEVVRVSHRLGPVRVDLADVRSLKALFSGQAPFDAVVCAAGLAKFGPLAELLEADFIYGMHHKFLGQVNVVRLGTPFMAGNGSFTLTSGVLSREPQPGSAAISPVNAAVEGFVRAAALELPRGIRINVVSPPWVKETMAALGMDSDAGLPAAAVASAYVASVEGDQTGGVVDARLFV